PALDASDRAPPTSYRRSAADDDTCADRAAKPRAKLAEALAERAAREEAARWPVDDPPQPRSAAEGDRHETLLAALALSEPGGIVAAASRFREHHPDSPFVP